jgi:integration host factor subunit alpha
MMHAENLLPPVSSDSLNASKASEKAARTVTRYDLATAIMKRVPGLSRREAQQIVECALQEIADALSKREECVKLHEFGTFSIRERANRSGRDPLAAGGASVRTRKTLNFRPSLGLKEKVEKGQAQAPLRQS